MRKLWIGIGALIAAIVFGAIWALSLPARPGPEIHLPDGSMLTLQQVTVGKEHRLLLGGGWHQALARVLPEGFARRLGVFSFTCTPRDQHAIVFWAAYQGSPQTYPQLDAEAFDEQGNTLEVGNPASYEDGDHHATYLTWALEAYPRRGRMVGLRIFPRDNPGVRRAAGEFRTPNPYRGSYPNWTPERLPAARTAGDLSVSLVRLVTGVAQGYPLREPTPGQPPGTTALLRIRRNGRPDPEWEPTGVEVTDATGNVIHPGSTTHGRQDTHAYLGWEGALPAAEPAYRVRLELSQQRGFSPAELWTVRAVKIPEKGHRTRSGAHGQVQGVSLDLEGLANGVPTPEFTVMGGGISANLRVAGLAKGTQITLARVADDRGRPVTTGGWSGSDARNSYELNPSPQAKTLTLTFAVHRSRYVEFTAKPDRFP